MSSCWWLIVGGGGGFGRGCWIAYSEMDCGIVAHVDGGRGARRGFLVKGHC